MLVGLLNIFSAGWKYYLKMNLFLQKIVQMNERLHRALELKLFEDQRDTIKLTTIISNVVDKQTQEKIEVVKSRLIKNFGYCDICATDALNFVASIFAKGDSIKS